VEFKGIRKSEFVAKTPFRYIHHFSLIPTTFTRRKAISPRAGENLDFTTAGQVKTWISNSFVKTNIYSFLQTYFKRAGFFSLSDFKYKVITLLF